MKREVSLPVIGVKGEKLTYIGESNFEIDGWDFESIHFQEEVKIYGLRSSKLKEIEKVNFDYFIIPASISTSKSDVLFYKVNNAELQAKKLVAYLKFENDVEVVVRENDEAFAEKIILEIEE